MPERWSGSQSYLSYFLVSVLGGVSKREKDFLTRYILGGLEVKDLREMKEV